MVKTKFKSKFVCQECGYVSLKWLGKCPGCNLWNCLVEEKVGENSLGNREFLNNLEYPKPVALTQIEPKEEFRISTCLQELDRVLGGGVVLGSLILVSGDPGIGKSTLLLQAMYGVARQGILVLYVSGEESLQQVLYRATRLNLLSSFLKVVSLTNLVVIKDILKNLKPKFVVIDSIQTIYSPDIFSAPGSVSQVRECTNQLLLLAKEFNFTIVVVGHVTKTGSIAGPMVLEHMVDAVLYFEGEKNNSYRILRAKKNRFGSTNELGIFEMVDTGLREVANPSEVFLSGRSCQMPGTAVAASLEGTRPVLLEIQALVTTSNFVTPKRMATGLDYNRVTMLVAVLEKKLGFAMQNYDIYVNVVGGIKVDDPALDLALVLSIISSFKEKAIGFLDVFIGEVGLTGEVRSVLNLEKRVFEAANLGFKRVFVPNKNLKNFKKVCNIDLVGIDILDEVLQLVF